MRLKTITWKLRDVKAVYKDIPQIDTKLLSKISSPCDLYNQFKFLFENETVEKFVVFWLTSANKVSGFEVISSGSLNASIAYPREIFRGAIVNNCANMIIAHNHPSGNLEPSNEDIQLTKKLVESGKILDINIFDHIIFGDGYTSFVERRIIGG